MFNSFSNGWFNVGSLLLGFISWIFPIINIIRYIMGNKKNWITLSILSMSACIISLWFQIIFNHYLVEIEDWSALMDTTGALVFASAVLIIVTIILNIINIFLYKKFLISQFNVELIVNFGVVGGLTNEMALTKTCIVENVVHYDFDTSDVNGCSVGRYLEYPCVYIPTTKEIVDKALDVEPSLRKVICASGDKFITKKEKKEELHNIFKADICEMEAAGIVLTCNKNKVPCLLIKTVSDSVVGGASEFKNTINESARICLEVTIRILDKF